LTKGNKEDTFIDTVSSVPFTEQSEFISTVLDLIMWDLIWKPFWHIRINTIDVIS